MLTAITIPSLARLEAAASDDPLERAELAVWLDRHFDINCLDLLDRPVEPRLLLAESVIRILSLK